MSVTFSVCRVLSVIKAHREANAFLRAFSLTSNRDPQLPRQALSPPAFLEWVATCRTGSRIYGIAHLGPTNPGLEFPKESSRLPSRLLHCVAGVESPSHRTKFSNRRRSRRSRFFVWQKRHKFASVRPKELRVWRPDNRAIFSGGPKWSSTSSPSSIFLESHDLKTAHTDFVDVFFCFHAASRSASARGRPHVHIHFDKLPWLLLSKRQRRKDV